MDLSLLNVNILAQKQDDYGFGNVGAFHGVLGESMEFRAGYTHLIGDAVEASHVA